MKLSQLSKLQTRTGVVPGYDEHMSRFIFESSSNGTARMTDSNRNVGKILMNFMDIVHLDESDLGSIYGIGYICGPQNERVLSDKRAGALDYFVSMCMRTLVGLFNRTGG